MLLSLGYHWIDNEWVTPEINDHSRFARNLTPTEDRLGAWLAAALSDENACDEFKTDIHAWFAEIETRQAAYVNLAKDAARYRYVVISNSLEQHLYSDLQEVVPGDYSARRKYRHTTKVEYDAMIDKDIELLLAEQTKK